MGIRSFSLTILLIVSCCQLVAANGASDDIRKLSEPISETSYKQILQDGGIDELLMACEDASKFSLDSRLRELSYRLTTLFPQPLPVEVVIANAQALLACKAPDSAQKILSNFSSPSGLNRREWLIVSWQAANASMDHLNAALALRELVQGKVKELDKEQLVVSLLEDGSSLTRSALDLLADHEISLGQWESAAKVLMAGRKRGSVGVRRMALASQLLERLSDDQRQSMLEIALENAAKDKAWWLASDILKLQLILDIKAGGEGVVLRNRLEKLAKELDDSYTLWEIISTDVSRKEEAARLKNQLWSPRNYEND